MNLRQLLKTTVEKKASDLHIIAGVPPIFRVEGVIVRAKSKNLTPEETQNLCFTLLKENQKKKFQEEKSLEFAVRIKDISRFRVSLFYQRGSVAGAFRRLLDHIPDLESLKMPPILEEMKKFPSGLVLITGPTGSGKSTTVASLINQINKERRFNIITLEDPIEYVYKHEKSVVSQREVGLDTKDFKTALKEILRQDCNVCVLGELRDLETIETALLLAETGHLVFATLHTRSAVQTVTRLISVFPPENQWRIRTQLSESLNAVVSQRLLRCLEGGRVAAVEVLILNTSVRNLIREDQLHQVYSLMQIGQEASGMNTMNQSLMNLVLKRKIDLKSAFEISENPSELDEMLKKIGI